MAEETWTERVQEGHDEATEWRRRRDRGKEGLEEKQKQAMRRIFVASG